MLERFLTEKLPNVKTCPSIKRTAVWLLPAVTCVLGPGKAWTSVGHPLGLKKKNKSISYKSQLKYKTMNKQ